VTRSVAVDVSPCCTVCVREFVWSYAYDRPILVMKLLELAMHLSAVDGDDIRDTKSSPHHGPGILAQRMNEGIVETVQHDTLYAGQSAFLRVSVTYSNEHSDRHCTCVQATRRHHPNN
jgi:hypothetical protein